MASDGVIVIGQVYKVQTLVDGGVRLTLDLPESAIKIMGELARFQVESIAVKITIKPAERQSV